MDGAASDELGEAPTVIPAGTPEPVAVSGEEATLAGPKPSGTVGRLRRGQAVGRFIVVDPLGAGAMGEVVAAYDPDLHRRVAIKVLRVRGSGSSGVAGATERMLREARAMAQLSHPNVITVFEVDQLEEGELFIAMEFVDGGTLRSWAREVDEPRPWREVIDVYAQAARGLAGAHAAGMVHRDFKPDNVLIGSDGRVRVTDFGLVGVDPRVTGSALSKTGDSTDSFDSLSSGSTSAADAIVEETLTRTGTVMGTPAYMAPEQERGNADPRSDQFSFCVALYEALYGERPFAGDTLALLRANVAGERIRSEPRDTDVPSWLRAIVLRGLSSDPGKRWEDMVELADALGRDPTLQRRQMVLGGGALLVVGGAVAWSALVDEPESDPCSGGQERLEQVWTDTRSGELRAAFDQVAPEQGAAAHEALDAAFDEFAQAWVAMRREACEATVVRHEQSDRMFDRRMRCLDRKLDRADALVTAFENPTAESVTKAQSGAGAVPGVERCADVEALEAEVPPPDEPGRRETWDRLHRELDRADALGVAGKEMASLALYEALTAEVADVDHPPLSARLHLNYGNALVRQQRWTEAIKVLDPGPEAAAAGGDPVVEAQMWLLLAKAHGFGLNDSKTGATMARAASVAAVRAGDDPDVQMGIQYTLSLLRDAEGDFEGAVEYAQRSVELAEQVHGKEHRTTSVLYGNLGSALDHAGKYDEAMAAHQRSMAIDTALHGEVHPDVGHSLVNIGLLLENAGKYDEAKAKFERALEIYEQTTGTKHGAYTSALLNLSLNALHRTQFEEARERLLALLDAYGETRPEDHADFAFVHQNLGTAYTQLQQLDEAEKHYQEAYRIRLKVYGEEHPSVMHSMNAVAQLAAARGDLKEAESLMRRAVVLGEKSLPAGHPDLAYPVQNLGNLLTETGRAEEAVPHLRRAVELRKDIDPNLLGRSEFALARALYSNDRAEAMKVLEGARAKVDELGQSEIQLFLDSVK